MNSFRAASGTVHVFTRETGGRAEMGWIKPICSCGWAGDQVFAYEDYQHTLVNEDEQQHYFDERNK